VYPGSVGIFVALTASIAAAIAQPDSMQIDLSAPPPTEAIANRAVLAPIFRVMDARRVAIVGIGDSNQLFNGYGWDEGFQAALTDLGVPMFATGLISGNHQLQDSSYMSGFGYYREGQTSIPFPTFDPYGNRLEAPASVRSLLRWRGDEWQPNFPGYVPAGLRLESLWNTAMIVSRSCPIDFDAALSGYVWHGRFDPSEARWDRGSFTPAVRADGSNVVLARSPRISTTRPPRRIGAPVPPVAEAVRIRVPRGQRPARTTALRLGFGIPGCGLIAGPFYGTYMQLVNDDEPAGYAYSTMYSLGGRSLYEMGLGLRETPEETPAHFFEAVRRTQLDTGLSPLVVVVITSGLNDRARTARSLGPASAPSNTPEGYADNLEFMVNRLRASYARAGGSESELFFLFLPSHLTADVRASPNAARDEQPLRAYRAAAADLARRTTNAASVDLAGFMTAAEAQRKGWYDQYGRAHLTPTGYFALSRRVLSELRRCEADVNADGFVDAFDLIDFESCFVQERCVSGINKDFNLDGFVDGFDFYDFIMAFESGCQ
jgi:hypothetical protein